MKLTKMPIYKALRDRGLNRQQALSTCGQVAAILKQGFTLHHSANQIRYRLAPHGFGVNYQAGSDPYDHDYSPDQIWAYCLGDASRINILN